MASKARRTVLGKGRLLGNSDRTWITLGEPKDCGNFCISPEHHVITLRKPKGLCGTRGRLVWEYAAEKVRRKKSPRYCIHGEPFGQDGCKKSRPKGQEDI